MEKTLSITNESNTNSNSEVALSFTIPTGTETININDKLLTNYEIAQARAKSEFLDNGYISKRVTISTYYLDDVYINDTIQVNAVFYKIIRLQVKVNGAKVNLEITAERWE